MNFLWCTLKDDVHEKWKINFQKSNGKLMIMYLFPSNLYFTLHMQFRHGHGCARSDQTVALGSIRSFGRPFIYSRFQNGKGGVLISGGRDGVGRTTKS